MELVIDGRSLPFPELDVLSFDELGMIKRATGLRSGELQEAFAAGDTDALLGLMLVALQRADGKVDVAAVKALPIVKVEVIPDEAEAEEDTPFEGEAEDKPANDES